MKRWAPLLGAVIGGVVAGAIAWAIAGAEVSKLGDWRNGPARFIGMLTAIGLFAGYAVTTRVVRGRSVSRDGFTLSLRPLEPVPSGYRELAALTVANLLERLRAVGYAPQLEACNELGERVGECDPAVPLAGANVAILDPGVRGWIRLQLPVLASHQARALGLLEIWSETGDSTEELALFTLRALDGLVSGLAAKRETSNLGEDPVALLTAGLGERPVHRR
jgi:hypothetical protein